MCNVETPSKSFSLMVQKRTNVNLGTILTHISLQKSTNVKVILWAMLNIADRQYQYKNNTVNVHNCNII